MSLEVTEEKNGKEGKMSFSVFIIIYTVHLTYLKVYTRFEKKTGSNRNREIFDRNLHWKHEQKGTNMQYVAVFVTQYNSSLSSFVPNFRLLSQVVADKSLTEKNVHMYFIGVAGGKNEKLKKEGKMRISILIFIYTIHIAYLKVYTIFKTLASIGAEKTVTEIFIGDKEK